VLEQIQAIRYVTPLREGGSLPGIVEADDDGTYVLKLRGAGQGLKVLVAEVIVGEIGRAIGLRVPQLRAVTLDARIARYEADEEVQDLLTASVGLNLGVDFLPGSFGYDGSQPPSPAEAAKVLWLDAFTANIDRTWNNPNLLVWHGRTWAIDHGAALYFHHSWPGRGADPARFASQPYDAARHVLLGVADDLEPLHEELAALVDVRLIDDVLEMVPDEWLEPTATMADSGSIRTAYRLSLLARRDNPSAFHRADAAGYVFWAERLLELDAINPSLAGRLARVMDRWSHLAEPYRSAAREAIARVAAKPDLSNDVREIVTRALEDQ